jgi:hypothetical protein
MIMADKIRVLIQMAHTPEMHMAMSARTAPTVPSLEAVSGFTLDAGFSPVSVPRKQRRPQAEARATGRLFTFDLRAETSTYLIRGEVENEEMLKTLAHAVAQDPNGIGVFSDPRVSAIAVCPGSPVGNDADVEQRLNATELHNRGMDGTDVVVAIVDTGINMAHLNAKGKNPTFDSLRSWSPVSGSVLGDMAVDHGTMCAFDVCITAPNCTLLDYALLQSQTQGETAMDGFLSDAVKGYSELLNLMNGANPPRALVVNNSWGMFHPSWDFPVGDPGNYSDNPDHPFNIIVESLEDAGADILFAAGNCGSECADSRCEGETDQGIYGANSSRAVLSIAGVTIDDVRLGYSTQGPGRLDSDKPDVCAYTHFDGSEVYSADSGTSAACPVAAGVVAAIRSRYPAAELPPSQLKNLLRRSARDIGMQGFDFDHGFGVIDTAALLNALDAGDTQPLSIGQTASGTLGESGAKIVYRLTVGGALDIALDGPQGVDFDIYVRKGDQPTTEVYDYRGYTNAASEKIRVDGASPGDYYVMVRSYRGSGSFTLKATLA